MAVLTNAVEVVAQTNSSATGVDQWTARSLSVVLPAGTYTLEFRNQPITLNDFESLIDHVSLESLSPP